MLENIEIIKVNNVATAVEVGKVSIMVNILLRCFGGHNAPIQHIPKLGSPTNFTRAVIPSLEAVKGSPIFQRVP